MNKIKETAERHFNRSQKQGRTDATARGITADEKTTADAKTARLKKARLSKEASDVKAPSKIRTKQ